MEKTVEIKEETKVTEEQVKETEPIQVPAEKKENVIIKLGRKAKNVAKKHGKGFIAGVVTTIVFIGGAALAIVKNSDGSEEIIEVDPEDYEVTDSDETEEETEE